MHDDLLSRLRAKDRSVLGRVVSAAENDDARLRSLLLTRAARSGRSPVVGFTGAPGSGKSTLIDALTGEFRRRSLTIAIVAIDPSSPFSGGAVLGDRCRMNQHHADSGVYIRSLSARGSVGGLSIGASRVIDVLKASEFDLILIETVGAGQSEVDVAALCDLCVVVCTPNAGDDIQAIKSGILEIADVLVANKSDLPGCDRVVQQLTMAQGLTSDQSRSVPIVSTAAAENKGIDRLADRVLQGLAEKTDARPGIKQTTRRQLVRAISSKLEHRLLNQESDEIDRLCKLIEQGEVDIEDAASAWVDDQGNPR